MEQEKVVDKLKEALDSIKTAEGQIDPRAGNAEACKTLARSQRLMIDAFVGCLHVGALEPEPEIEEEPEAVDDEFDVDSLKTVYAKPAAKKATAKKAAAKKK